MTQHEAALKGFLTKYKHPNEARTDIINTITEYRDLRPTLDPFVFNDGTERDLVQLEGTIPVTYKGKTYNIPVSIWVLDTHPYNPPMVFVKPTSTMQIRTGRYVDANGKVDMAFIRDWRHPSSDLLSLVQVLTFTFGEECPVFSRSSGQQAAATPPYTGHVPYPMNVGGLSSLPYNPGGYTGYPPPSVNPPNQMYPGYPLMYPMNPPYLNPDPQNSANFGGLGSGSAAAGTQFNNGQAPPYYTSNNTGSGGGGAELSRITPGGTVTEADLRASLLSAVEDKIRWRLRETYAQAQAEMDVLCKTQQDMIDGKLKLDKIVADLNKEKDEITGNIAALRVRDDEVKESVHKMEGRQDLRVDDAVVTTAPLYRQLLNAFAEEQATEDAIYYLGEALRKNVIELESFLKRVRELSRRQFILRATIQKCREKARLPALV